MKNPNPRQLSTVAEAPVQVARNTRRIASLTLLSGLLIAGTAHAKLSSPYDGGPGGTLTNVSGTASITTYYGNSSQSIAGQTPANANVEASGIASIPIKYSDVPGQAPWTVQFQSGVTRDGSISLTVNSNRSDYASFPQLNLGSFVEQASWRATLVNTTGKTALFGVDMYSGYNDALGYAAGFLYGNSTPGFSAIATATFGNQQYDVSNRGASFAIDGVLLQPDESATVGLDFKITGTGPYLPHNLSYMGNFIESFSTPVAAVPEPSTNVCMALGLVAMIYVAKRRKA